MNRRKHANAVPVAALFRWVVVAFFLGSAGLSYVYFKNQMHTSGNEIHNLETQLASLQTQDEVQRAQIDRLSAHGYLERRLSEGFIHLVPISDDRIVRLRAPNNHTASADTGDEMRHVANSVIGQ